MNAVRERLLLGIRSLHQDIAYEVATQGGAHWPLAGRALRRLERALVQPLRLNVFGEANTGKSSLVNYLLRRTVVPAGGFAGQGAYLRICHADELALFTIATDGTRNRLTSKALARIAEPEMAVAPPVAKVIYSAKDHGAAMPSRALLMMPPLTAGGSNGHGMGTGASSGKLLELGVPHEFLRRVEIVEARAFPEDPMPRALTQAFRPAHVTIWCTLATQAWKETERATWARIPSARRKRAFMLVTYRDAIRNPKDEAKILARLRNDDEHAFADALMVSVRDALEAETAAASGNDMAARLHARSNVDAVEAAVNGAITASQQEKLRKSAHILKLVAAVVRRADANRRTGPGQRLAGRLERMAGEALLAADAERGG